MTISLNEKIVNDTFNKKYNEQQFSVFIKDLLIDANFEKAHNIMLPNDYKDFIKSAKRICKYKYTSEEFIDDKVIDVLVVKLKKTTSVERARVAQRNFIARYLNGSRDYQKDGALVAFISEDENGNIAPDWRFSFVQMNYITEIVEKENGKKKRVTSVELTPAKRFSFLVGENEDTHTAQRQFATCLEKSSNGEKITIEDLVQAFDIEKVSKEFFDKYKALYLKLRDELTRLCEEDKIVNKDFENHNINVDDFAKKTLGQLVFLYFIQKKGWLGVEKDKDWGTGDKKFLRKLFDKAPEFNANYDNFFNDILEHLFYEALATDRGPSAWFDKLNCRIPFLNGGLFDPVNGYEWTKTDLTIDNNVFKEIFDTFDLYNFTVKEDEPLEKEVAIDPEMLGKVFENLLPENERKGNGAFYTPREIVHYMCQESLINYLYNKINIKEVSLTKEENIQQLIIPKEDIEFFVKTGNSTYVNKTKGINVTLPSSIKQNADILDNVLSDIKVCDPAIGSGAFPVGMMNEIVRARATLSDFIQLDRSIYQLKRNAIENSIYGVDIDPGAVEIAKLRFWLSLVVDEEDIKNIKPLPNLDYKIMQGNSLITSYEGIDFDTIVEDYQPEPARQTNLFEGGCTSIITDLKNTMSDFVKTPYTSEKQNLKQKIENLIYNLVKTTLEEKAQKAGKAYPKDFYEEQIRNFAQNKEKRNFFPWKLFFADVFDKGGFDVVIGNPPYVGEKGHKETFRDIKECNLKEFYQRKMDLFYFFFHLALNIAQKNASCGFITTNYYITAFGATKLRTDLKNRSIIENLINFNELKIFDSALGQHNMITLFRKGQDKGYFSKNLITNKTGVANNDILQNILNMNDTETEYYETQQLNLYDSDENYIRCYGTLNTNSDNNTIYTILSKIKDNNKQLINYCNVCNGLLSGVDKVSEKHIKKGLITDDCKDNGIFILSDKEIEKLNLTEKEKEIIKPLFKNSDIKHYYANTKNDKYIIYATRDLNIGDYPNIKRHFERYEKIIKSRSSARGEIQAALKLGKWWVIFAARNKEIFEGEKIICPQRSLYNYFAYNNTEWFSSADVYYITQKDTTFSLKYILALLNSKLYYLWLYHRGKRKGESLELYYAPLTEIPIKKTTQDIQSKIIDVVDKILSITKSENYLSDVQKQQSVKEYENQIDIMVYKLYDLTYSEVQTIDQDFSMSEEEYNNYQI